MNEDIKHQLSCFMDGENDEQAGKVMDKLMRDQALRDTWWRYHLISDTLKQQLPVQLSQQFGERFSKILADEATVLAPNKLRKTAFVKPLAGLAIAASVATIAVIGVQQSRDKSLDNQSGPVVAQQSEITTVTPRVVNVPARLASTETSQTELVPVTDNSRLNSYLVNYNEFRTTNTSLQGMLPYVRIIAHENNK